ncbi:MAG: ParB/RepB/Spo0J family partition protein [Pelagibacteraceae bacterium]|mgnify:FL=1|jgi:ParB family chromosome partitioning protein|nr:ParB/RepB/Spo0J family partition protein [Pelagibacteraceae bacterium]MDP6783836.1 ParB/RepB/Spo0J family partition protein [Alphaproteobacteria bacterium]MBO6466428.1 ParB/RepB/Spo0J family partition protein [Pelagibacteraceae bacterium]MBO6468392.1 ParB/RepB/Spo0J family partition protein [Pelagibacteraceae bacterium]MBO6468589.1 ParB/RepB/Spo0J family partition protein [Pelagibacteraceae bacterium]|tara:strand:+ start:6129 stop:6977 length:849 start_codon:yes stop_codon:yes gene_type:complete
MNKESKKLGRGLSSLLSPHNSRNDNLGDKTFKLINISSIEASAQQPRKNFVKEELENLSASIKSEGVLQPILVREKNKDLFEIIAGERRWRAAQIAGIHQIPAVIKQMNDDEAMQAALIENIQREDLNPIEEARAYKTILESDGINYDNLSNAIGKSKSHISNTIRLLELDIKILNYIENGKISMGHARALIGVPNAIDLADEIINKKLSVREVERNTSKYKKTKRKNISKDPNILDLEKELSEKIGLKTLIHFNEQGSSGSITLYYSDLDQLDDIMKRLKK